MAQENIESNLHENRRFPPSEAFVQSAALHTDELDALYSKAKKDHEGFWADLARDLIDWKHPFTQTLDSSNAPHYRWFPDGKLNVSYNCLDRQLEKNADKTAIIFEGEKGDVEHISYRELHKKVCVFANALKAQGVNKGDRVIIYMPMITEAVIAMQACARIGAIHSVVFGGFSASSLKDRIEDTGAKLVIAPCHNCHGQIEDIGHHYGGKYHVVHLWTTICLALGALALLLGFSESSSWGWSSPAVIASVPTSF